MKLYVFRDSLFCWVCAVVASSLEEAIKTAEDKGHKYLNTEPALVYETRSDDYDGYKVYDIVSGLVIEGGGNG